MKPFYSIILSALVILGAMGGCTEDFQQIDKPKTTAADIDSKYLFTRSLVTGSGISVGVWQYQHQLRGSVYAQHFTNINSDFTTANFEPLPGNTIWEWYYARKYFAPLNLNHQVLKLARGEDNPIKTGVARIWNVYLYQILTDQYGDIPYFNAFEKAKPAFDPQQEIYADMLSELDQAVEQIKDNRNKGYEGHGEADVLYQGNLDQWIRFANTLTMRLALRVSNVAEQELTIPHLERLDVGQTMQSVDDAARILPDPNGPTYHVKNPLSYVSQWNEIRVSQTMMNFLKGYDDPRLEVYANPNEAGEYVGLRNGQPTDSLSLRYNNHYVPDYCNIGSYFTGKETPHQLLTYAEACFLKAEAAYKGYISGSAEDFYNQGIRASFRQYGITNTDTIEAYLQGSASYDPANALKQIHRQRWIALYPNGREAWSLVRRTGHPQMMEPVYTFSGNQEMPRRVPYPTAERRYNKKHYQQAVSRMGGDSQYTRVWWDTQNP